jgi:hypothetical protein
MIEELERALALAAYIVLRHGPTYAPYIDRLERELENARKNDPTERAKRTSDLYGRRRSEGDSFEPFTLVLERGANAVTWPRPFVPRQAGDDLVGRIESGQPIFESVTQRVK